MKETVCVLCCVPGAALRCPVRGCSVLRCVAVCCSMLQYVAVCCSMLQCGHICELQCVAVNIRVAVCFAPISIASCRAHVCCSVVQVVAVNMCVSECCAPRAGSRAVNSTYLCVLKTDRVAVKKRNCDVILICRLYLPGVEPGIS